jgi:hypothetical protein
VLVVLRQHDLGKPTGDAFKIPTDALDERLTLHERRSVLWADGALDVTGDVVKELMVPQPERKDGDKADADKDKADKKDTAQPTPDRSPGTPRTGG